VTVNVDGGTATGAAGTDRIAFRPYGIFGGEFNDRLTCSSTVPPCAVDGEGGADVITGTPGDDVLTGNRGNDRLVGRGGSDTASYSDTSLAVNVNLRTGTATGLGQDTLVGISQARGGFGNDVLTGGGPGACSLDGRDGNDRLTAGPNPCILIGGAGNDTLTGSTGPDRILPDGSTPQPGNDRVDAGADNDYVQCDRGDDVLDAGPGKDEVDCQFSGTALNINLVTGVATGFGADTIRNAEVLRTGSYADIIQGTDNAEDIYPGDGANTVQSGGGDDLIVGGWNNDWIYGGAGNDTIAGNRGDDTLYGGSNTDTVTFVESVPGAGVTADLSLGRATGPRGADQMTDFENVTGGEGDDVLVGTAGPNVIDGWGGIDTCTGGGGLDVIRNCP
jgi:Ca2+-binding RTX toxin-like protein